MAQIIPIYCSEFAPKNIAQEHNLLYKPAPMKTM